MASVPKQTDQTIIVVGLGKSAVARADALREYVTVGVNDVSRFLIPTYHILLDNWRRFPQERLVYIELCPAKIAFICHESWIPRLTGAGSVRKIRLKRFDKTVSVDIPEVLHFRTSPFAAIHLAYLLGAKRIGVIGMDLLKDHHMNRHGADINKNLSLLRKKLEAVGAELYNCSPIAALPSLPFKPLEELR
jgi:hypothetical protein